MAAVRKRRSVEQLGLEKTHAQLPTHAKKKRPCLLHMCAAKQPGCSGTEFLRKHEMVTSLGCALMIFDLLLSVREPCTLGVCCMLKPGPLAPS